LSLRKTLTSPRPKKAQVRSNVKSMLICFWREYVFKFASVVGGNPENWW
jgi:hypothetical protein